MTEPSRMILDVDTGIDDAMAIFYAVRHPAITLEAVTTTYGNIDTPTATSNSLKLLELFGASQVPVSRGVERSLIKPFHGGAKHVHGGNGIGDVDLPEAAASTTGEHASDTLIRLAKENPGELTLCPVGPITNVALAFAKAPEIAKLFRKVVIMGSTIIEPGVHGLPSPNADPNWFNDPEAAHIVLTSGADITLVGLDVTMPTLFTTAIMDEVAQRGDHAAQTLMRITRFYAAAYETMYPGIGGCSLHDPLAVAIAHDPSLATTFRSHVRVELHGELTRGETVADRRSTARGLHNAEVCLGVDRPRFITGFIELLTRAEPPTN